MAVFPAVFGLLMAALVTGQSLDISPREEVRAVGSELEVLCKVPWEIDSCRFQVGQTSYRLLPQNTVGDVIYHGLGLKQGECGAIIRNIKEEWNGKVSCLVPPKSGSGAELTGVMTLIVAKAPKDPVLLASPESFREGQSFMAQCVVADGRPAATIRWFLDDMELLNEPHQAKVTSEPGSDLQTITRNLTRTLGADDDGRNIICKAEHTALPQPKYARRQLVVQYPPKVESNKLTTFGLKLNAEGRLNVTVRANPAPTAEWTVDGQKIEAPNMVMDQMFTALQPLHMHDGFYNITLIIGQIKKEDVDRTYYLHVSNGLGSEDLTIRISTMEEPAGVELDTGAIVGIVIAVLVVLIAISLVVFAFATDRWCFAGRGRDNTKNSGESTPAGDVLLEGNPLSTTSDTESAVGGKERSRLAQLSARVRAALPRAKDKVQATETVPQEDEEKPAEDKVVYATLALSEQTPAEKPPPAFAEYAEIVYTDQGQKDVKETA